jgi:hypothetical protein
MNSQETQRSGTSLTMDELKKMLETAKKSAIGTTKKETEKNKEKNGNTQKDKEDEEDEEEKKKKKAKKSDEEDKEETGENHLVHSKRTYQVQKRQLRLEQRILASNERCKKLQREAQQLEDECAKQNERLRQIKSELSNELATARVAMDSYIQHNVKLRGLQGDLDLTFVGNNDGVDNDDSDDFEQLTAMELQDTPALWEPEVIINKVQSKFTKRNKLTDEERHVFYRHLDNHSENGRTVKDPEIDAALKDKEFNKHFETVSFRYGGEDQARNIIKSSYRQYKRCKTRICKD